MALQEIHPFTGLGGPEMTFVGPYQGKRSQYGLEFHFGVDELAGGGAIVFNGVDGCIWTRLPPDKNIHGFDHSLDVAHKLCHAFNGSPGVDTAGIDGTP